MEKTQPLDLVFAALDSDQLSRLKHVENELNTDKHQNEEIILLAFNKMD